MLAAAPQHHLPNTNSDMPRSQLKNTRKTKALTECKLRQGQDPILASNPDVHRIAPKMYWIHSLVGVGHFAITKDGW